MGYLSNDVDYDNKNNGVALKMIKNIGLGARYLSLV